MSCKRQFCVRKFAAGQGKWKKKFQWGLWNELLFILQRLQSGNIKNIHSYNLRQYYQLKIYISKEHIHLVFIFILVPSYKVKELRRGTVARTGRLLRAVLTSRAWSGPQKPRAPCGRRSSRRPNSTTTLH